MKAPPFAYVKPSSLHEVFELLERHGGDAKILAGGQSMVPALNMRLSAPAVLIDVNGIEELCGITLRADTLRIGALTRHRELTQSADIAQHAPLIAQAMPYVAHAAIRTRGTFGGSLVFADPAAELPACAVALDAQLVLASKAGERRVPAREFFTSLYTTALRADEVLVAAELPMRKGPRRSAFLELARRQGDYAIVGVAVEGGYTGGKFEDMNIVFFGVDGTPVLAKSVAAALDGRACSDEIAAAAQAAVEKDIAPGDGLYESAATKLHLAKVLVGRGLRTLASEPFVPFDKAQDRLRHAVVLSVQPFILRQAQDERRTQSKHQDERGGGRAATGGRRVGGNPPQTVAQPRDVIDVTMTVNGSRVSARVSARQHLVDFLRDNLGLTGAHLGCEHGVCGACTVQVDGEIVRGCLMLAAQADGASVETIEGLTERKALVDLQRAFHQRNAAQCGFCSPAMLITAAELVERKPPPTREEIREHISGNYCRCTGYQAIVDAIEAALSSRGTT